MPQTRARADRAPPTRRGTKVTFKPDPQIFETTTSASTPSSQRLRELAFLNRGHPASPSRTSATARSTRFQYEGGISSFVEHLNENKETAAPRSRSTSRRRRDGVVVEIALQYNDGYDENIFSFANNINTHEGGTHLAGFKSALTRSVNDYAAKPEPAEGGRQPLDGDDLREGLTAVVSVKVPNPQFEGQTKTKLGNSR